jgi:hypothetical protein
MSLTVISIINGGKLLYFDERGVSGGVEREAQQSPTHIFFENIDKIRYFA